MKVKGISEEALRKIAKEFNFRLWGRSSSGPLGIEGRYTRFTLHMPSVRKAPDAPYRKRGFSGHRTSAVCFHGHWLFFRRIFEVAPQAVIVTKFRRWTSAEDLEAHAEEVGRTNAGSMFNPQTYEGQCGCTSMPAPEHKVRFSKGVVENGVIKEVAVRVIKQSDLLRCPFAILVAEHYREDGTCKCNDPEEQKRMIKEWGYSKKDFAGLCR